MIIGLSGYKGSGKDTVAAYLVKEHGFERKAFADPLKQSVAALFGIPFADIDKIKSMDGFGVAVGYQDEFNSIQPRYRSLSFRELLQRYGTEAHRDVFGQNFWLDYTLPLDGYYPGRAIVVTDVRFRNEAERVKCLGGFIWRIHRGAALDSTDQHRSESYDYDDLIDDAVGNDGTLNELFDTVSSMLADVRIYAE